MIAVSPRDTREAKCLPHRPVQAVTDSYLIPVSPMTIPEPLNINSNDGPVNGRAPILHLPSPREQGKQVLASSEFIFDLIPGPSPEQARPGQGFSPRIVRRVS
jgi:hypothetical protein